MCEREGERERERKRKRGRGAEGEREGEGEKVRERPMVSATYLETYSLNQVKKQSKFYLAKSYCIVQHKSKPKSALTVHVQQRAQSQTSLG